MKSIFWRSGPRSCNASCDGPCKDLDFTTFQEQDGTMCLGRSFKHAEVDRMVPIESIDYTYSLQESELLCFLAVPELV